MKASPLVNSILSIIIMTACPVLAQRFASRDTQTANKPDIGFMNAEKAYFAFKAGDLDDARKHLLSADASNPFAMFVRAALIPDAGQATNIYKVIVNEYPGRPIAREALLQLYKYHYAAGNYRLARADYLELCKYPGATQLVDPAGLEDTVRNPALPASAQVQGPELQTGSTSNKVEKFSVQLGLFSTRENAERLVARLKTEDIKATVSLRTSAEKKFYAVTTGKFSTREDAEHFASHLKSKSIDCVVVKAGESRE